MLRRSRKLRTTARKRCRRAREKELDAETVAKRCKSGKRAGIEAEDYDIVANLGDQESDLA